MNAESWDWILRSIKKFALFGVPAGITLFFWQRRRIDRKNVYRASCANVGAYVLWILAGVVTAGLIHIPAVFFSSLPSTVLVFWPFLGVIASLLLCLSCIRAEMREQPFIFFPNLLMLILWISSVVAPN